MACPLGISQSLGEGCIGHVRIVHLDTDVGGAHRAFLVGRLAVLLVLPLLFLFTAEHVAGHNVLQADVDGLLDARLTC